MNRISTTPGLYPLPDDAKETLSDLKGHQKHDLVSGDEGPEIEAAYDDVREELVGLQRDAGLDRVVEGQGRWDDMLAHPLTVHENVETGGIVRYYDNNNFYRDPIVEGELTFSGDLAADLEAASELTNDLQAVVPGPYSLSELATDEHYGDDEQFLAAVAEFLAGEVEAFPDVETVFVLEPSLVTDPPAEGEDERASDAIDTVAQAADADVVAHTYWGALEEKVHAHLLDAGVDAIGYDFVTNHEDNLYNVTEYGTKDSVALGVVDGQNTLVESPETIRERVDWFRESVPEAIEFDDAYVTANTGLFYLPVNRFEQKLQALADATREVTA
ncbi:5-methyltetrahydropteroyltriglutamate--homocysteine S-methyltransferase (methionine synthase II) [Halobacterium hubeiense]|uniref:5-methyltetrahydropteroyltriglutamate--homocysteine S-methyltransferase (Methionine synthase II) n=1 Tax=Halobacterium hubeiense TaxID=1407499 RepID=A0A0U5H586_9EURY|nr:5-methyltetrahydropteroyltriglutamate--homocysteine methyltransferase [Halobacterium hubeiense]CQH58603.1 5-methyltetrahydropteroyltriglutamate--homocysteine S-methyltransferase (methionine synthase II) [Halobacterium hubeiense]